MVECELDQVAQKWLSSSQIYEYIVININFFSVENHAIIEILNWAQVSTSSKMVVCELDFSISRALWSNHCPNFLIQPNHI